MLPPPVSGPALSAAIPSSFVPLCLCGEPLLPSIIEQKLLGIDQRPDEVLVPLAQPPLRPAASQVGEAHGAFVGGRRTGVGDAVELVDLVGVGAGVAGQSGRAAGVVGEPALEGGRVEQEEALRQARLGRALALADA